MFSVSIMFYKELQKRVADIKIGENALFLRVFDELESTNTTAKKAAAQGAAEGTLVLADRQTAGRGRMGRSFFSPCGGIYMSLLLRPRTGGDDTLMITVAAAAAAAEAIEEVTGVKTGIKWVNDIFANGRKVCGILTEGVCAPGGEMYAVLGIGINLVPPKGGFPDEIKDTAGALCGTAGDELRAELIARLCRLFSVYYADLPGKEYLNVYRKKSVLSGKKVRFLKDNSLFEGTVTGIDGGARLCVNTEDGEMRLSSGEVQLLK